MIFLCRKCGCFIHNYDRFIINHIVIIKCIECGKENKFISNKNQRYRFIPDIILEIPI